MCSSFKTFPIAIACCFIATGCADSLSFDINSNVCCVSVNNIDTKTACSRWRETMTEHGLKTVNCKHTKASSDGFIHGCSPTIIYYNDNVKILAKYISAAKWKDSKCNIIAEVDFGAINEQSERVGYAIGVILCWGFLFMIFSKK